VLRVRPPELIRLLWEFLFDPGQQDYWGWLCRWCAIAGAGSPAAAAGRGAGVEHSGCRLRWWVCSARSWEAGIWCSRLTVIWTRVRDRCFIPSVTAGTTRWTTRAPRPWSTRRVALIRSVPTKAAGCSLKHYPLRLMVFNACDTGRDSVPNALSCTAAALIHWEIPVVAMQFEITDSAAIRSAQSFYQTVANVDRVDDSVMRARRALRLAKNNSLESADHCQCRQDRANLGVERR
jgi:CHAT domain